MHAPPVASWRLSSALYISTNMAGISPGMPSRSMSAWVAISTLAALQQWKTPPAQDLQECQRPLPECHPNMGPTDKGNVPRDCASARCIWHSYTDSSSDAASFDFILEASQSPILEADQAVYRLFEMHCQTWPLTGCQYGFDLPTYVITLLNWQILSGLLSLLPLPKQSLIMKVRTLLATPAGHAATTSALQQSPPKLKSAPMSAAPVMLSILTTILSLLSLWNPLSLPAVVFCLTGSSSGASARVADPSPVPKVVDAAWCTPILLGADAHFHAPQLVKRSGSPTLATAIQLHPPPQQLQLDLLVPSFYFPTQWPMSGAGFPQEACHYAIGWHPNSMQHVSPTALHQLKTALQILGVCALGEVGLDCDRAPNAKTCAA